MRGICRKSHHPLQSHHRLIIYDELLEPLNSMQDEIHPLLEELKLRDPAKYKHLSDWQEIPHATMEGIAMELQEEGEIALRQGDPVVYALFALVRYLTNEDRSTLLRQAQALAAQKENIRSLCESQLLFKKLASPDKDAFLFWRGWGDVVLGLGFYYDSTDYYLEAHSCYQKAKMESQTTTGQELGLFFWNWGKVWVAMAKGSGEALEFNQALTFFESAQNAGMEHGEFWWEYGEVLWNLGSLLRREEYSTDALEKFLQSAACMPDEAEKWFGVAKFSRQLFELSNEEAYYQIAQEALEVFTQLEKDQFEGWLEWGKLESLAGKLLRSNSTAHFESSFEKFAKAETREPDNGSILSAWAEAELCLAVQLESLDLLKKAEVKARRGISLTPADPDCWQILGTTLNELGNYFRDDRFFFDAIQQFRQGLKIDKQHPFLWYGCALAHFSIGEMRGDPSFIKQAVCYCERLIELGGSPFPQFWNDWGVALLKYGELTGKKEAIESAIEKFEKAIAIVPDETEIDNEWLYNYGSALDFLGDFSEDEKLYVMAVQQLKKVVEADPDHTAARYNLAQALVHLGEVTSEVEPIQEALEHFEHLARLDYEDELIHSDWGYALLTLSQLLDDPGNPEASQKLLLEAEASLQRGIALGCITSWYYLACLHALSGRTDEALHLLILCEEKGILPPLEDVLHEEWLDALHKTDGFRNFISSLGLESREDLGTS